MQTNDKKTKINDLAYSAIFFALFVSFTLFIAFAFRRNIQIETTQTTVNAVDLFFYSLITPSSVLLVISEIIGYITIFCALSVGVYGVYLWIKNKSVKSIDTAVVCALTAYFITVILYVIFEFITINYRPMIIDGALEKSYPSSHTLLAFVVCFTLKDVLIEKLSTKKLKIIVTVILSLLVVFTAIGRLFGAMHWFSDVVAGVLLGASICFFAKAIIIKIKNKN